ncbi:MAG: deoxyribodipyrimidine photo-lyase [Hyphomicrobiales bacterium]|nr:deoxyribodipyrimidine photo-lyase [Hyphomicrobiales bacterium]
MSSEAHSVVWFRDDLRLADHPALAAAAAAGRPLLCLYVLDEAASRPLGNAAHWWLAGSLRALDRALQRLGNRLVLRRGSAAEIVTELAGARGQVYWNRRYDSAVDRRVEDLVGADRVASFQANVLFELEPGGKPPRVFTPFWRRMRNGPPPRAPLPTPGRLPAALPGIESDRLEDWKLEPTRPDWAGGLRAAWQPGEAAAQDTLETFLADRLAGYPTFRDRPDIEGTSRLSPHLRFGEVSPFQCWHAAQFAAGRSERLRSGVEKFLSELGWREFSYQLLSATPDLARTNLQRRFDGFAWTNVPEDVEAWQRGRTGYPIVDAGMRQLWQTGWMHNRVRMVAASFLVKHLLVDWRLGEAWFWDTLVDADPANNPASWQWVAGCGADAAPYFRVFNPILQGERFDPDGRYVRTFVPELARLPTRLLHRPWEATELELRAGGVVLGTSYPRPLVDHAYARKRALDRFADLE